MKRASFVMQSGLALRALAVIIVMLMTATTAWAQATNENEAPVIEKINKVYSIDENSAVDAVLGSFTVKDVDKPEGSYEKLTYSLTGSLAGAVGVSTVLKNKTLADIFYLKETAVNNNGERTVEIRVKNKSLLDYEELYKASSRNASYPVTITITDMGSKSVTITTKITVQDVNEGLSATGGTFYIQEHSPGLSHVCTTDYDCDCDEDYYGRVKGEDLDKYNKNFGTLTYSMSTSNTGTKLADSKFFVVDPDDGSITTSMDAEFEYDGDDAKKSYTFFVTVSDGVNSKDVEVTVEVLDITEPPINLVEEGSGRIREDACKGTNALTFKKEFLTEEELVNFNALGDVVKFKINDGADGYGVFKAVETTGEIILEDPSKIDFETLCAKDASCKRCETFPMYKVDMTAKNANGPESLSITRYIEIVDVNEPPIASDLTKTVDENIPGGTVIGTISASDPDRYASSEKGSHSYGFKTLHYSIVNSAGLPFEIDQTTGVIKLKRNKRLRYSEKNQYKFDVKVSDRATSEPALSTIAHVTINVRDLNEPSEFVTLGDVFEVEENVETGTKLEGGTIVVLDDDQGDVNKLTITITDNDATTTRNAANLFEVVQVGTTDENIHKSSFAILTKADLDYEALYNASEKDAVFNVTLTITDRAANTISQDTKIRIFNVNEKPAFTKNSYEFKVQENIKNETSLGVAKATDPDIYTREHETLHFSLEGDDAELFMIDYKTGEISTIYGIGFDYETKKSYSFQAVVTDGEFTDKASVTVTVKNMDECPEFPEKNQSLMVAESAEQGTTVGVIAATDDDLKNGNPGKKPKYSLVATDDAPDDFKKFNLDDDGVIKVAANPLPAYATQHTYRVRVVATDGSDPTLTSYVDVTIKVLPYLDNLFDDDNAWTIFVAPEDMAVVDGSSGNIVTDGNMGAFLPSSYTFGSCEVELTQLQGAPKGKPVILGRPTDNSGKPIQSSSYLTIVPDASDDPTEVTVATIAADYDAAVNAMDKQHFAITDGTKKLQTVIEGTGNSTSDAIVMVLNGGRFKSVYISDNDLDKYAKDGLLLFILSKWEYLNVGSNAGGSTNAARSIGIGDRGATAIDNGKFLRPYGSKRQAERIIDNWAGAQWYDLQGRRIEKPTRKGIYIRNGQLVVVK